MKVIVISFLLLFQSLAFGKSLWIHVVGQSFEANQRDAEDLKKSAETFFKSCKLSNLKMKKDCLLFYTVKSVEILKEENDIDPRLVFSAPHKESILEAFERALESSKQGDTIIFSVMGHGGLSLGGTSCVYLNLLSSICQKDIDKRIRKHKKEGVMVFIVAQSCNSGAITDFNTKEVCSFTSSSSLKSSTASQNFWEEVALLKEQSQEISVSELRHFSDFYDQRLEGGGFKSQRIRDQMCDYKGGISSEQDFLKVINDFMMYLWDIKAELESMKWNQKNLRLREAFKATSLIKNWKFYSDYIGQLDLILCTPTPVELGLCVALKDLNEGVKSFESRVDSLLKYEKSYYYVSSVLGNKMQTWWVEKSSDECTNCPTLESELLTLTRRKQKIKNQWYRVADQLIIYNPYYALWERALSVRGMLCISQIQGSPDAPPNSGGYREQDLSRELFQAFQCEANFVL